LRHKPVLLNEVLNLLNLSPGMIAVDGTLGGGGHAVEMMKAIAPTGRLIAVDQDPAALKRAKARFETPACRVDFEHENFRNLPTVLSRLNVSAVDAVLLDIGFSSDQLEDAGRGFSFEREGPLDMRMNPELETTASDFVNHLEEEGLANMFYQYGEERHSRRIARVLCERRQKALFITTQDLAETVAHAMSRGRKSKYTKPNYPRGRHPATRVFQSLRIAVNDELGALQEGLDRIWPAIRKGGRLGVISFHSLEDRIVKRTFLRWKADASGALVTKKPVTPGQAEIRENPRSRSAKLRVVEKSV